ncbi:MAG: hypothetical protein ACW967_06815 [Candidatus Hodarchaeales archaeon]
MPIRVQWIRVNMKEEIIEGIMNDIELEGRELVYTIKDFKNYVAKTGVILSSNLLLIIVIRMKVHWGC